MLLQHLSDPFIGVLVRHVADAAYRRRRRQVEKFDYRAIYEAIFSHVQFACNHDMDDEQETQLYLRSHVAGRLDHQSYTWFLLFCITI